MMDDPFVLRLGSLYLPLVAAGLLLVLRRRRPTVVGVALAVWWNLGALHFLNPILVEAEAWRWIDPGLSLAGKPVDLWLGWAFLWGAVFPLLPFGLPTRILAVLLFDLLAMPLLGPVVWLSPTWWLFDLALIALVYLPGDLIARYSQSQTLLRFRLVLLMVCFWLTFFYLIPLTIYETIGLDSPSSFEWPSPIFSILFGATQLPFLWAIQGFARDGGGTFVPLDPSQRLIDQGIYAWVRNPIQISIILGALWLAVFFQDLWYLGIAGMTLIYSLFFASQSEDQEGEKRFGTRWVDYTRSVPNWIPRWRAWQSPEQPPASLYVDLRCPECASITSLLGVLRPQNLLIHDARNAPKPIDRITYQRGSTLVSGAAAIERLSNHLPLPAALVCAFAGIPILRSCLQLVADTIGVEPHRVASRGGSRSMGKLDSGN